MVPLGGVVFEFLVILEHNPMIYKVFLKIAVGIRASSLSFGVISIHKFIDANNSETER